MKLSKKVVIFIISLGAICGSIYYSNSGQIKDYFKDIYFNYKHQKHIKEWFNDEALNYDPKRLHDGSGWDYLSVDQYKEIVLDGISKMDPPIKKQEKIFELGVGIGATLREIENQIGDDQLEFGGVDLAENAIAEVRKILPKDANNFFVGDMTQRLGNIPDNYYDHTVSFGALAMYLSKNQIKQAIKEAVRITKPGGSLLFTCFIAPGGYKIGSILTKIEPSFFEENAKEFGIKNIRIYEMKHQGDRYQVTFQKQG